MKEFYAALPSPNFAVSNLLLLRSVGLGPRRREEEEGENLYFKESQSGVDMDRVAVAVVVDGPPGNISSLPPSPDWFGPETRRKEREGGTEWHDL